MLKGLELQGQEQDNEGTVGWSLNDRLSEGRKESDVQMARHSRRHVGEDVLWLGVGRHGDDGSWKGGGQEEGEAEWMRWSAIEGTEVEMRWMWSRAE